MVMEVLPYNYTWFYNGVISNQEVLNELPGEGYISCCREEYGSINADQVNVSFIELTLY